MIQPQFEKTFEAWRNLARNYLSDGVDPAEINWSDAQVASFFGSENPERRPLARPPLVPKTFMELAEYVAFARGDDRWDLLYRILFRLQHDDPNLMNISVDPDVLRANLLAKSVRRDIHKMHAFVRFKKYELDGQEIYIAWHKAEHFSMRLGTPFFVRRFGDRPWSLFTPDESAHWDLKNLHFGKGLEQHEFDAKFGAHDDWDEVWKTYYKSIFNPARIKIKMMKSEMSPKYWQGMPETALISEMIREAPQRLQEMASNHRHAAVVDETMTLTQLKNAAHSCTACPIHQKASRTVFGEGPKTAPIMIVGEQPGEQEDISGAPFVGPAGKILMETLDNLGIKRADVYLTNAVKHFKWVPQGKARIHQKPSGNEMQACKPWLEAEIAKVKPKLIVALGATAATAVVGRLPKISSERGKIITNLSVAPKVIISWHPSAILRAPNETDAAEKKQQLKEDLELAFKQIY